MAETISLELSNPDLPTVALCFERTPDRWAHRWCLIDQGNRFPLLHSVEGTPEEKWPPSPPLQELNQLDPGTGSSALAVGMAGRSHWSASYSIESALGGLAFIKADLACLQKEMPEEVSGWQLGSTYELNPGCLIESVNEERIEILGPTGQRIVIEASQDEDCATFFEIRDLKLFIFPKQVSAIPNRATRWAFGVQVTG